MGISCVEAEALLGTLLPNRALLPLPSGMKKLLRRLARPLRPWLSLMGASLSQTLVMTLLTASPFGENGAAAGLSSPLGSRPVSKQWAYPRAIPPIRSQLEIC